MDERHHLEIGCIPLFSLEPLVLLGVFLHIVPLKELLRKEDYFLLLKA